MSHTAERIRTIQLFQSLGGNGESPGAITLRSLELAERLRDREKLVVAGLNALQARYPNDLIFANAGFAIGVVRTIIGGILDED
jgi:hypothetical protein